MRVLLRHFLIKIGHQKYWFIQFISMSVYLKNHKSDVESELWMVPLNSWIRRANLGIIFLLDQYYTGIRWTKPLSSRHSDEWRHSRVSDGFKFIEENHSGLWSYKTSVSQTIINVINDVIAYIVTCLDSYVTAYVTIKTKGGAKAIKIDFKIPRGDYFKRRTR